MGKGDADNLRADLDDGFARVANLLLEGLCCAPLTAAEYSVALFIIRRTYGWSSSRQRQECKTDAMTAEIVSLGTALSRSGVHKALQSLVKTHVILQEPVKAGNYYAYGMNCDLAQWGLATPEWKTCKQQLGDARDSNTYNRGGVEVKRRTYNPPRLEAGEPAEGGVCPAEGTPIPLAGHTPNPGGVEVGGLKPCGTGPNDPPTDSSTDNIQTKDTDSGADAAAPRAETEMQKVIREAWEAVGLPGVPEQPRDPKSGRPLGKSYGYLGKLLNQHGFDLVREWTRHVKSHPVPDGCKCINHRLPEGAKPWDWFVEAMADGLNQPFNWRGPNGSSTTHPYYAPRQDPTRPMGPTDNSEFGKTEKEAASH